MNAGMRITTGAEFTHFDAPVYRAQLDRAAAGARDLFDLGPAVESVPWFGSRPCFPDMLPLVGKAPRHEGLWCNFGHAHQGFTLGPTTGMLLAGLMTGEAAPDFMNNLRYRWN
jgi:D-amino-acid dehydrogenase